MLYRRRSIGMAALVVATFALVAAGPAVAQPRVPTSEPAGISVELTITARERGTPDATFGTVAARINADGSFAMRLAFSFEDLLDDDDDDAIAEDSFGFEMIGVGDRLYLRLEGEGWQYIDLAELRLEAERLNAASGPRCGERLPDVESLIDDPIAALRSVGTLELAGSERIDGVPVAHFRGTLDLARLADALTRFFAADPACAEALGGFGETFGDLDDVPLPAIRYDVYVGQEDRFPYRVRVVLAFAEEAGELEFLAEIRPSAVPFPISPPADATPLRLPDGLRTPADR